MWLVFFSSYSSDTQIIYTSSATTTLQLSPDGVFTNTRTTLTNSNSVLTESVPYTLHTISAASEGGTNMSAEAATFGDISEITRAPKSLTEIAGDLFGAYRVLEGGVTLELQFADGSVERKLYLKTRKVICL